MKVQLLPSSWSAGPESRAQYLTTFLINDTVAIDAGSLGLVGDAQQQARIRHVLLSHAHIDHIASLPLFLDNVYDVADTPVTVHASAEVWDTLRAHVFNDRVWPDLTRIGADKPFCRPRTLVAGTSINIEELRIAPVAVNHTVPTLGYIIEDATSAVVIVGDTGPTEEIWRRANRRPRLAGVFLEVSYPDAYADLGRIAKHLTPATFAQQIALLKKQVPVYVVHIKASFAQRVEQELTALNLPGVQMCRPGQTYDF